MECKICGSTKYLQKHHMFSQSKLNIKLYSRKLIDDPKNIMTLCINCHLYKTIPKWNEKEFCEALGIKPRSKTGLL